MFDTYEDIFNQRGAAYHAAMTGFPAARDEEFAQIISMADLRDGDRVVDIPSGGGYLRSRIQRDITLTCIETSHEFAAHCSATPGVTSLHRELHNTLLASASFDKVICLAGLHHVRAQEAFFAECRRLLRPSGLFCIADAPAKSATASFLDEFVHAHNSMGHQGDYVSNTTRSRLRSAGFAVLEDETRSYHWNFSSVQSMTTFCTLLFGIDRGSPEQVREGVSKYLGYEETSTGVRMNWQLNFLVCSPRSRSGIQKSPALSGMCGI
jgi:cyclopropane fatty-acyl-phospholipid synthase-like methyltransferase